MVKQNARNAWAIGLLKRSVWLRTRYRAGATLVRYARYRWYGRGQRHRATITFECFVGRSYAGSPRALYEAMLDDPRYADCRFVWTLPPGSAARDAAPLTDPRTTIVSYRSAEYYRAYARARIWISNSILAPELRPRRDQVYVQTWHGTPLKRIGLDVVDTTETAMNGKAEIDGRYRGEARKVTVFVSSSRFTTRCFASAFDLPPGEQGPFVETGNPRNDQLAAATDADVAAARAKLGIPEGKRVILYAPTWRDDQHDSRSGYVYRPALDPAALREQLGEDTVVLFRMHYLITNVIDFEALEGFVKDVSKVDEINELCLASDVLVTDYSSIYFDYALLDRPMVFYMYDRDRYGSALRGFYRPLDGVPGPVVTTQDDLVAALADPTRTGPDAYAEQRAQLRAETAPHDDGHASRRLLDLLSGELSPDRRTTPGGRRSSA